MIREANMNMTNGQHHEWFVPSLTPHLRSTLWKSRLITQVEVLEIMMRLHEAPMQDPNLRV